MAAKYVLKKTANGRFMFNLQAGNGEVILTSEQYAGKEGAEGGIDSVRANSPQEDRYEKRTSSSGQPYFVLKAGNNEIIGLSEMYASEAARDNGIASVQKNGPIADVRDDT